MASKIYNKLQEKRKIKGERTRKELIETLQPPVLPKDTKLPEGAKPAAPKIKRPLELGMDEGCEKCDVYVNKIPNLSPELKKFYEGKLCPNLIKGIRADPNFFLRILKNRGIVLFDVDYFAYLKDIDPDAPKCLDRALRCEDIKRPKPVDTHKETTQGTPSRIAYVAPGLSQIYDLGLTKDGEGNIEVNGDYGSFRGSGRLKKELTNGIEMHYDDANAIFDMSKALHRYTLRKVQKLEN